MKPLAPLNVGLMRFLIPYLKFKNI
jgi:hypothetical protein